VTTSKATAISPLLLSLIEQNVARTWLELETRSEDTSAHAFKELLTGTASWLCGNDLDIDFVEHRPVAQLEIVEIMTSRLVEELFGHLLAVGPTVACEEEVCEVVSKASRLNAIIFARRFDSFAEI
jgi:hypothetical protein